MPDIDLQIDELVLHGFPSTDRARIGDAIHAELVRLLSGLGDQAQSLAQRRRAAEVDAGSFAVGAQSTPQAIGGQIAQRIVATTVGGKTR